MRTFLKYLFTPGYTLIVITSFCIVFLVSGLALLIEMRTTAFTISAIWVACFVASILGTYLRFVRYRDYGNKVLALIIAIILVSCSTKSSYSDPVDFRHTKSEKALLMETYCFGYVDGLRNGHKSHDKGIYVTMSVFKSDSIAARRLIVIE